jgi:hypothetical protein
MLVVVCSAEFKVTIQAVMDMTSKVLATLCGCKRMGR